MGRPHRGSVGTRWGPSAGAGHAGRGHVGGRPGREPCARLATLDASGYARLHRSWLRGGEGGTGGGELTLVPVNLHADGSDNEGEVKWVGNMGGGRETGAGC